MTNWLITFGIMLGVILLGILVIGGLMMIWEWLPLALVGGGVIILWAFGIKQTVDENRGK